MKEAEKFEKSTLFEGIVSLRALLLAYESTYNDRRILEVLYDTDKIKRTPKEYMFLKKRAETLGFRLTETPRTEIDLLALGQSHGGILAKCTDRTLPALENAKIQKDGFYVMLEGIEDPYNFGYALRSLYAAGVNGVILPPRNWMSAAGIVCRASAGAAEQLPLFCAQSAEDAALFFKDRGYALICADLPNSVPLYDTALKLPLFLVVGGEKRGISKPVLEKADAIVRIDYGRDFPAALSAASAAAILGFEIFRQNRN
ncbi:MAG: RNA methyltransferase [Ruminococcaceae bacterium]|nr:RNA methyltransferase [Oscillospiraceae bacterium]